MFGSPAAARRLMLPAALLIGAAAYAPPAAAQDAPDVEAAVAEVMDEHGLPGAAVAVVIDGEARTYGLGFSDLSTGAPVDPERTGFPIDSATKSFTATAVMNLVDDGLLDLDADVNEYLRGIEVPDTYPGQPITLRHLLTHTAGFEETVIGNLSPGSDLPSILEEHLPGRVRPPGELAAYSNHGVALAGLAAADALGVDYEELLTTRVLAPLGLHDTALADGPASFEDPAVATLYGPEGEAAEPVRRVGEPLSPAGGLIATAADMGRFMRFHLGDGDPVLSTASIADMHGTQFRHDPRLPGAALGFSEGYHGELRTIGHGGDGPGSHSMMTLVPDRGLGVFIVFNGDGTHGGAASADLAMERVLDVLLGERDAPDGPGGAAPEHAADAASGTYRTARMNHSDYSELPLILGSDATVTVASDGSLTTTGLTPDTQVREQHWEPLGDGLYRERDGTRLIAFGERDGRLLLYAGTAAYTQLAWYEELSLHALLALAGLVLMASLLAWPVAAAARRLRRRPRPERRRGERAAAAVAAATGLLITAFTAALVALLADPERFMIRTLEGHPDVEIAAIPILLAAAMTAAMAVVAALSWSRRWWGPWRRAHYTAAAMGALLVIAFATRYHLTTAPLTLLS
jgi:CubicO group peptidase (beta-lactamase class C family)